jgi:SMI1 / KNR4 family (SUKH-1)
MSATAQLARKELGLLERWKAMICPDVDFHNPGPALTPADIEAVQRALGIPALPADYHSYLLRLNGATPLHTNAFPARMSHVRVWYPVGCAASSSGHSADISSTYRVGGEVSMGNDLLENNQVFKGRIPQGTLAIGANSGGSQFLLDLRPQRFGQVIYWEPSFESREQWEKNPFHNVGWIANDFVDFINRIEVEPDDWDAWEASLPEDSTLNWQP